MSAAPDGRSARLAPYVPRLVVEWLREAPDATFREVEGSLAFVDVSGFTQLTERLARGGKIGAEEVTATLDACFTRLLSVPYHYGAGLLKWGGDAVLLLFTGPGHAARAGRAAIGMQRKLGKIGRLRTTGGSVTLRMSIGIHAGTFHLFLVGDHHRELIVAGPAATTTVEMEAAAAAGEIVVSESLAAALDPRSLGAPKGGGLLLRREPDAPTRRSPVVDASGLDLTSCLPVGLREHLLSARGEGEHRPVTAAFVEAQRTDELLSRSGPAAVADALHETVSAVQTIASRYGVVFFQSDIARGGVKLILVAGAPTGGGNEDERMLRAVKEVIDRPRRLPLRIGVNRGRVFAGDFGPPYRRTYALYGDALNTAARLMGEATLGQVLASEAVLAGSRTRFELGPPRSLTVKGKAEPVRARAVGAIAGAGSSRDRGGPFVGRDRELKVLLGAVESARSGGGRVVEILGEPGIGKSRLVDELRARADGVRWVGVACVEYESAAPYVSLRALLRQALGLGADAGPAATEVRLRDEVARVAPELRCWIPLLGIPLELELPDTPETSALDERFFVERLAESVDSLLAGLLPTTAVLLLEDAHWMDEASAAVLRSVAANAAERPWVVLVTRRDVETGLAAGDDVSLVVRPRPLTREDARALVTASMDDSPLPPHVISALAERAAGNPLFLVELLSATRGQDGSDELPDSIETLLTGQIDRLAPRDRWVLRYASALGGRFELELLVAALPEETASLDAGVWERLAEFVEPDGPGALRFRHALIRDAAYEALPYRRRRELHARIGATLEHLAGDGSEERIELLALHFFHAQGFERAWRYSRRAAARARSVHANVEAAGFLERALESARRLGTVPAREVASVSEALGDVRLRLGELERAAAAYRDARRRLAAAPAVEAGLFLKEAQIRARLGRYTQALRWINRGLRAIDASADQPAAAERARLSAWYAAVRQKQGQPRQTIVWCRRAIAEAEASAARDALAHAYFILDWAYVALGQADEAVHSRRALEIYEDLGDLEKQAGVLNNLGVWAYFDGRWNEALELYERARQAWEAIGDRWSAAFATSNIGEILTDQGRLDEAEPLLDEALHVWRASKSDSWIASATRKLGRLTARRGRPDDALELLEDARGRYVRDGEQSEVVATDAAILECLVLRGDHDAALELAADALHRAESTDGLVVLIPTLHRLRGCALLQAGRREEARGELEESVRIGRLRSADYEVALTLDVLASLARLERDPEAARLAAESRTILGRLGVVTPPAPSLPWRPARARAPVA